MNLLTPVQAIVLEPRRTIIRGRIWSRTVESSPLYSILPDGKRSLSDVVHDIPGDRLQAVETVETIRLVKR